MTDLKDIASFVVKECALLNYFINLTKLQKLIFCCYGAVLADSNIRICKEYPKATSHGPVFPELYDLIVQNDFRSVQKMLDFKDKCSYLPESALETMKKVIKVFGKYNAGQLIAWTLREDSPWNNSIDDETIKNFFKEHVVEESYD